jgi:hypothetical protein
MQNQRSVILKDTNSVHYGKLVHTIILVIN